MLLLESASRYEKFGVALLNVCRANPIEGEAFKSIRSLSQQTRQLASRIREEVALPMQGFMATHGETLPAIYQKYTQSRQRSYEARQRALLARKKYMKAVQEAEEVCNKVKEEVAKQTGKDTEKPESSNTVASELTDDSEAKNTGAVKTSWEQDLETYGKVHGQDAADRVKHLLNDVKILQKRYQSLAEKENYAVKSSQQIESVALDGLQKLEEQRACLFNESLVRTLKGIKELLDNLEISSNGIEYDDSTEQTITRVEKKGDIFTNFLKVGIAQQEKTGVADAATLGLDDEIGKLRDQVQTRIAARTARIRKVKTMGAFFEDVSLAALKLGEGLKQVIKQEASFASSNKGAPIEQLRKLLTDYEGPRAVELWKVLVSNLEKEAEASLQFSRSLKSIKSSKLDHFLSVNEDDLQSAAEHDDARWKHLCDAARTEMRAEARYRQGAAQTVKARDRVSSIDKESLEDLTPKSPQKINRARDGMNKALGNMFKILPDGGEQAMSMLAPDARRAVVERSLQEADENESRLKQAWDQAITTKTTAMNLYRSKAEPLVKKYEMEDMSGVEDIKAAMESLVSSVKTLRLERLEALSPLSRLEQDSLRRALKDVQEWTQKTARDIMSKVDKTVSEDAAAIIGGFMLDAALDRSESVKQVMDLAGNARADSFDSEASSDKDDASIRDASVKSAPQRMSRPGSSTSLDFVDEEEEKASPSSPRASQKSRWLHKSFSTPLGKPDAFKTFKRFNSMDEPAKTGTEDQTDDVTEVSTVSIAMPPQTNEESIDTDTFYAFWPDYEGTPPVIVHSFACAYLPKDCSIKDTASIEHGRLFVTNKSMVFVAWKGKKAILLLSGIVNVEPSKSVSGLTNSTMLITAHKGKTQSTLLLGCFSRRDTAVQALKKLSEDAKKKMNYGQDKKRVSTTAKTEDAAPSKSAVPTAAPVAPDATIKKMENVLSKKLGNLSIAKFHHLVWANGTNTPEKSFYAQWLDKGDCYDIRVGDWEQAEDGMKGPWCGETYTHKRVIDFKFKRKTHLYIGPPIAEVKQTQYCRVDGDRSVMQMTVAFDGIPYSDAFSVEVRWVASRSGAKDISVEVGVFVDFQKKTMLQGKIRAGTITETKPVHASLFDFVKNALGSDSTVDEQADNDEVEGTSSEELKAEKEDGIWDTVHNALPELVQENLPDVVKHNMHIFVPMVVVLLLMILRRLFFSASPLVVGTEILARDEQIASLNEKVDQLQTEMKLMRESMEEIVVLLQKQGKRG